MTRRKKSGLTIDDHTVIGLQLERIAKELLGIELYLSRALTLTHPATRQSTRAVDRVARLRCELENVAAEQFPKMRKRDVDALYYPSRRG